MEPLIWPAWFDIALLNFFVWDQIKNVVYQRKSKTLQDLKNYIEKKAGLMIVPTEIKIEVNKKNPYWLLLGDDLPPCYGYHQCYLDSKRQVEIP